MFASDALSRHQIEAEEDVHDVILLKLLHHLNATHIYHYYEHLACNLYKHKAKHQAQMVTKLWKDAHPTKTTNCKLVAPTKVFKMTKNLPVTNKKTQVDIEMLKSVISNTTRRNKNTQVDIEMLKSVISNTTRRNPIQSLAKFLKTIWEHLAIQFANASSKHTKHRYT